MKHFTADFETTTWEEDKTRVWAWATCNVEDEKIEIGNNIDDFIKFCKKEKNSMWYFHNLKFDGEFLIYWCLTHNFKHVTKRDEIEDNTFTTLIDDMGQFYNITIYFKHDKNRHTQKATFIDSLKIINMSVSDIAKTYGLEITKLSIDYNEVREEGHELTEEEREYIKNDVLIVAKALKVLFNNDLKKMTAASNALTDYKDIMGLNRFNHFFPHWKSGKMRTLGKHIKEVLRMLIHFGREKK